MSNATVFGQVVREARKKQRLSQEALAGRCGLHHNAIGLLERGERTPNLDTILAIAKGLDMNASTLIARVERELDK